MMFRNLNQWHPDQILRSYLAVALAVFFCSFLVGTTSKFSNNLFYIFIGLPTVAFILYKPREAWFRLKPLKWLLIFFALSIFSEFLSIDGDAISGTKHPLYLLVFACSLLFVSDDSKYPVRIVLFFSVIAMIVLTIVMIGWLGTVLTENTIPRAVFNDVNPTRTALLLLTALIGLWLFLIEPWLDKSTQAWCYGLGICAFVAIGLMIFIMFQSRSTLLSLLLFLLAQAIFRGRGLFVLFAALVSALALWISDWYEVIFIRGASYRDEIWMDTLQRYFTECNIFLGCGSGGDYLFAGQFLSPHSGYLANLYYYGIPATLAFSMMAVLALLRAHRMADKWFLMSIPGWGGALASNSGFINSPEPYWVYFWMPLILSLYYCSRPTHIPSKTNALDKGCSH